MIDFKGNARCTCGKEMQGSGGTVGPILSTTWRSCECGIKAVFYRMPEKYELAVRAEQKGDEIQLATKLSVSKPNIQIGIGGERWARSLGGTTTLHYFRKPHDIRQSGKFVTVSESLCGLVITPKIITWPVTINLQQRCRHCIRMGST